MTKKERQDLERRAKFAIKAAGGPSRLARFLSVERQAVFGWRRVPEERCDKVSEFTGIPKHELRPDLFRMEYP